jgi:hypothetical protein
MQALEHLLQERYHVMHGRIEAGQAARAFFHIPSHFVVTP